MGKRFIVERASSQHPSGWVEDFVGNTYKSLDAAEEYMARINNIDNGVTIRIRELNELTDKEN